MFSLCCIKALVNHSNLILIKSAVQGAEVVSELFQILGSRNWDCPWGMHKTCSAAHNLQVLRMENRNFDRSWGTRRTFSNEVAQCHLGHTLAA